MESGSGHEESGSEQAVKIRGNILPTKKSERRVGTLMRRRAALPLRRQPVAIKTRHLPPSLKERPPFRSTHAKPKAGPTRVLSIAGAKGRV